MLVCCHKEAGVKFLHEHATDKLLQRSAGVAEIDYLDPHRENLAMKASEVKRVPQVRLVCLALLVLSAPLATLVLPALTERLDLPALLAEPETRVLRGPVGSRAAPAQLVCL